MKLTYKKFWLLALLLVLLLGAYPLYMGGKVLADWSANGMVFQENYPKYVIPYTPITLALLAGTALLPLARKLLKGFALPVVLLVATTVFLGTELLLESVLILVDTGPAYLSDWQMVMCYTQATAYHTLSAVELLMGDYNPWFKLHFYVISLVLIFSTLSCFHGFGESVRTGDHSKRRKLTLQAVFTGLFLGLCVFACFTAFYRTGELTVKPISALLMGLFFVSMGVTAGLSLGGLMGRKGMLLSSAAAAVVTLVMYIGEMILLSGHVYRFGTGFFFDGLGALVLAPVDLLIILLSGAITSQCLKLSRR